MQCPQCNFVEKTGRSRCTRCGYWFNKSSVDPSRLPDDERPLAAINLLPFDMEARQAQFARHINNTPPSTGSLSNTNSLRSNSSPLPDNQLLAAQSLSTFKRGDVLMSRYRLAESAPTPKNQQSNEVIRYAIDTKMAKRRVIIRQVKILSNENPRAVIAKIVKTFQYAAQHPGFSPITDAFYAQGYYYFVQSAPSGESLATLIRTQGGALPERNVVAYGKQLCEMLTILENATPPMVHGAISPETVMVNLETQRVSLLFLPISPPSVLPEDNPTGYIAPEQAHREILPSSDLYSVAATLHYAVTGYDPRERLTHFYPPARRLNPIVTPALESIFARQLRLSVKHRYPTSREMLHDLAHLLVSYPPEPTVAKPAQSLSRRTQVSFARRNRAWLIIAASLIIILAIVGAWLIPEQQALVMAQTQQKAFTQQLNTEMSSFKTQGIGISDGRMIFDTYGGRVDTSLKQQAALAIQRGNMSTAVNMLSQAVSEDPIDGEAQIYNENIHLLQNNASYVTIIIGLAIDGSDLYLNSTRVQLQAVYLAQHAANTQNLLPGGLKLRILIANSGSSNNNVAKIAQFVGNRVSQDGNPDHIVAVVGWPYSSQTINARDILASVHIPLISQTASSVQLSGSSPYFFRVCPVDDEQGQTLGTLLVNEAKVKKILVLHDPTDTYSVSLANAVANRTKSLGATIASGTFTETQTTVDQYQQIVTQAVNNQDSAIFIAGYGVDGVRLAHAVGDANRADPTNQLLRSLKIFGGDAMTDGVFFGLGNNADAAIARAYPEDMRRLTATEFADANEWNFLHIAQNKQPFFFSDWATTYQSSTVGPIAHNPTQEAILIYDAVNVLLHAASLSSHTPTGDSIRDALSTLGTGNITAYQGVSGRIAFDSKGNPIDKAVVVVTVQANGNNGNRISVQKVTGAFR